MSISPLLLLLFIYTDDVFWDDGAKAQPEDNVGFIRHRTTPKLKDRRLILEIRQSSTMEIHRFKEDTLSRRSTKSLNAVRNSLVQMR
mmetsp:Transcript_13119/g.19120  ORF Transcript_13119/g.19120 Transcript_13119/m.19120 type:complete len:87 (+) Transcript_13119:153-413(+)